MINTHSKPNSNSLLWETYKSAINYSPYCTFNIVFGKSENTATLTPETQGVDLIEKLEQCRILLQEGASFSCFSAKECPYRKFTEIYKSEEKRPFIQLFIQNGGLEYEIKNRKKMSLLHEAAREEHVQLLTYLTELGVDVNLTDQKGKTPIYYSLKQDNKFKFDKQEVLEHDVFCSWSSSILILNGADLSLKVKNKTLSSYLRIQSFPEQVEKEYYKHRIEARNISICASHVLEMSGTTTLIHAYTKTTISFENEGAYPPLIFNKVRKTIANNSTFLEKSFPSNLIQSINTSLNDLENWATDKGSLSSSLYVSKLLELENKTEDPFILPIGYQKHSALIVFANGYLAICDRNRDFIIYKSKIPEQHLLSPLITKLLKSNDMKNNAPLIGDVIVTFSCTKDTTTKQINNAYPLGKQKVGNCVFASLEGALWAQIVLDHIQKNTEEDLEKILETAQHQFNILNQIIKLETCLSCFEEMLHEKSSFQFDEKTKTTFIDQWNKFKLTCDNEISKNYITKIEKLL